METIILTAIRESKKLLIIYDGRTIIIEPYHFGNYHNQKIVIGMQTGGFPRQRSEELELFFLKKMEDVDILNVEFTPEQDLIKEVAMEDFMNKVLKKKFGF